MKYVKFLFITLSSCASFNALGYSHVFTNNTNEVVDVEVNILGVACAQNRLVSRIDRGERREFTTFGANCISGINIWRTFQPRNPANLIGVWKFTGSLASVGSGFPCGSNEWIFGGHRSDNYELEGAYTLQHQGDGQGEFWQGSSHSWTRRFCGVS